VHLLHVTPNHPRARHPSHSCIWLFFGGCGSSAISGFERKNTVQLFPQVIFPGMAPLLSIHDGPSVL
jgi:hypothetical protein